jgi:hypothetical protein
MVIMMLMASDDGCKSIVPRINGKEGGAKINLSHVVRLPKSAFQSAISSSEEKTAIYLCFFLFFTL